MMLQTSILALDMLDHLVGVLVVGLLVVASLLPLS